jgi:hypothetical protein
VWYWDESRKSFLGILATSGLLVLIIVMMPVVISKWLFMVRFPFYLAASLVYIVISILVFTLVPAYLLWKVLETPIEVHHYYDGLKDAYKTTRAIVKKLFAR